MTDRPAPPPSIRDGGTLVENVRRHAPPQTILGTEQKAWFLARLRGSTATWKVWGNSLGTLDLAGHGYATVRASAEAFEVEFVCIPRPLEGSDRPADRERAKTLALVDTIAEYFVLSTYLEPPQPAYVRTWQRAFATAVALGATEADWQAARQWVLGVASFARVPDDLFATYAPAARNSVRGPRNGLTAGARPYNRDAMADDKALSPASHPELFDHRAWLAAPDSRRRAIAAAVVEALGEGYAFADDAPPEPPVREAPSEWKAVNLEVYPWQGPGWQILMSAMRFAFDADGEDELDTQFALRLARSIPTHGGAGG